MGILRKKKVNISFESLLTLSLLFTEFLHGSITQHYSRFLIPPAENIARVSSIEASQCDKCFYIANTLRAKV